MKQKFTISQAREQAGLSVNEVATHSGIPAVRILEIESNPVQEDVKDFMTLCQIYGFSVDDAEVKQAKKEQLVREIAEEVKGNVFYEIRQELELGRFQSFYDVSEWKKVIVSVIFSIKTEKNYSSDDTVNELMKLAEEMNEIEAMYIGQIIKNPLPSK